MMSWMKKKDFKGLLLKDKAVRRYLKAKDIDDIFDLRHYFRNIGYIFSRVFGGKRG